ncbi:hypothetical protein IscW_ISCW006581, partial [Ixodes scapularis]
LQPHAGAQAVTRRSFPAIKRRIKYAQFTSHQNNNNNRNKGFQNTIKREPRALHPPPPPLPPGRVLKVTPWVCRQPLAAAATLDLSPPRHDFTFHLLQIQSLSAQKKIKTKRRHNAQKQTVSGGANRSTSAPKSPAILAV